MVVVDVAVEVWVGGVRGELRQLEAVLRVRDSTMSYPRVVWAQLEPLAHRVHQLVGVTVVRVGVGVGVRMVKPVLSTPATQAWRHGRHLWKRHQ